MVEAVLVVLSLSGHLLSITHLGEPPGKTFTSGQACLDWFDTDEGTKVIVDVSNTAQHIYPVPVHVVPVCHHPNEA
jgi:hypothetical protein